MREEKTALRKNPERKDLERRNPEKAQICTPYPRKKKASYVNAMKGIFVLVLVNIF